MAEPFLSYLHRRMQRVQTRGGAVTECVARRLETEFFQDRLQVPLNEVIRFQPKSIFRQEQWVTTQPPSEKSRVGVIETYLVTRK